MIVILRLVGGGMQVEKIVIYVHHLDVLYIVT